jgi:hypothetical protein
MDTRYWGPSGWQLIHLIAFRSDHPEEFLLMVKDILPCRFCRESTTQFTHELPMKKDTGKWSYELHNKVNHKLRTQCKDDPAVIHPGEDPSFEEVKEKYMEMKPTNVPGRDFLFSIAVNYPDDPKETDMSTQRNFMHKLAEVFPFTNLRKRFKAYLKAHEVTLNSRKAYMKWMYGLLHELSDEIKVEIPSYKGYVARVMYFKSGCQNKTYRGKTCRRLPNGHRTKDRDHKRTFRITRQSLLNG